MLRRLGRHLFTALSVLSLLLCVAVCVLCVRSLSHADELSVGFVRWPTPDVSPTAHVIVASYRNRLQLRVLRHTYRAGDFKTADWDPKDVEWFRSVHPAGLHWHFHRAELTPGKTVNPPGFEARHSPYMDGPTLGEEWSLIVRPWLPALLLTVLPMIRARQFVGKQRAKRQGLCLACGYDLRATQGRCPECGTPASAKPDAV